MRREGKGLAHDGHVLIVPWPVCVQSFAIVALLEEACKYLAIRAMLAWPQVKEDLRSLLVYSICIGRPKTPTTFPPSLSMARVPQLTWRHVCRHDVWHGRECVLLPFHQPGPGLGTSPFTRSAQPHSRCMRTDITAPASRLPPV
jgi:hypothetical protein